jgi:uncharacterized protein with GYD domain
MSTSVILMQLTDQGIKDVKHAPDRIEQGIKALEALGGKVSAFYVTMGEYDYIAIGEGLEDLVTLGYVLSLGSLGNVRTTTLKAFTVEEFKQVVSRLP